MSLGVENMSFYVFVGAPIGPDPRRAPPGPRGGPGEGPGPITFGGKSREKLVPRAPHGHGSVRAAELVRLPRISPPELPICPSEGPKPFFLSTNWQIQGGGFPLFFENSGGHFAGLTFWQKQDHQGQGWAYLGPQTPTI